MGESSAIRPGRGEKSLLQILAVGIRRRFAHHDQLVFDRHRSDIARLGVGIGSNVPLYRRENSRFLLRLGPEFTIPDI